MTPTATSGSSALRRSHRSTCTTPLMRPSRWRTADRWVVGSCSLFVAIASMWGLASRSLWRDEASTWAISGHGLGPLVRSLAHSEADAGGLYLVLQYGWLHV